MTKLIFQDLPNIEDEGLKRFIHQIGKIRNSLVLQIQAILKQSPPKARMAPAVVTLGLLQRLGECSISIEILASKGRARDCAVLLVTIMELRLDLQYISEDKRRAEVWLSHTHQHKKPWSVAKQLKELFPVPRELEAEQENYRQLSMAKHGNPVGGLESFPIGLSRTTLVLPQNVVAVPYLCASLYCLGLNLAQAMSAGFHLLREEGFEVEDIERSAEAEVGKLQVLMNRQIIDLLEARRITIDNEAKEQC